MPALKFVVPVLTAIVGAAGADVVVLTPSEDNTLYESPDPASNGAGAFFFAGTTIRGAGERRALLRFDIAGAVPPGASIESASLTLQLSRNSGDVGVGTLHRVVSSWGEGASNAGEPGGSGTNAALGDATWALRFYPTIPWSTPGGDFVADPSGSTGVPAAPTLGAVTWGSTPGLVGDVRAWRDRPAENFGWLVRVTIPAGVGARRFFSREAGDPLTRPALRIVYTTPCPCVADFDGSGGTPDVGDIDAFFAMWLTGEPSADADCSGGTPDAGDVDAFFGQWLAGGC